MKALPAPPLFLLISSALLWGEIQASSVPEAPQAVADDALPLEKMPERIKQLGNYYAKQVGSFIAVVDAEHAAKRISDPVAQLLRTLAPAAHSNFDEVIKNIPAKPVAISAEGPGTGATSFLARSTQHKNEAILAASKDLEAASRLLQLRMEAFVSGIRKELRQQMSHAVPGRPKPEEIATLIQVLKQVQGVMKQQNLILRRGSVSFDDLIACLNVVKQLTEAENNGSATGISTAIATLRNSACREVLSVHDEIRTLFARALEPMRKATEDQGISIEAMIETRKPAGEITAAVEAYDQAVRKHNGLNEGIRTATVFSDDVTSYYRFMANTLKSLEADQIEEAERNLQSAADLERRLTLQRHGNPLEVVGRPDNRARLTDRLGKEGLTSTGCISWK